MTLHAGKCKRKLSFTFECNGIYFIPLTIYYNILVRSVIKASGSDGIHRAIAKLFAKQPGLIGPICHDGYGPFWTPGGSR